jgi:predicted nucleotidyltransferase
LKRDEVFGEIVAALAPYGTRRVAVFGSYARGEFRPNSDIDLLVEFDQRKSLLQIVRIEREVSERIGIKADLLTEKAISPYLVDRIKEKALVIYG